MSPLINVSLSMSNRLAVIAGPSRRLSAGERLSSIKKILLIQPSEATPFSEYSLPTRYPRNLFNLAAALIQRFSNLEVVVVDLGLPGVDLRDVLRDVRPNLVGITFSTPQYKETGDIVEAIRQELEEHVIIVGGGVHATALPQQTIRELDFDYIVKHEGEVVFPDLVAALDRGGKINQVKSLVFWDADNIGETNEARRIRNLDQFPLPTEVLPVGFLDQYANLQGVEQAGVLAPVMTSRGCSFACAFCGSNVVFLKEAGVPQVTFSTFERIMEELWSLYADHGITKIYFEDDFFDIKRTRAARVASAIIAHQLPLEIYFRAVPKRGRPDDAAYYDLLYRAGVRMISFGVESGDPVLLKKLNKSHPLPFVGPANKAVQSAGIKTNFYLMVGLPGQDWKSIDLTRKLLARHTPDSIGVAISMPYPGTALAKMEGISIHTGFEHMMHEPPRQQKGRLYLPHTYTDVMSSRDIGFARQYLLDYFTQLQQERA
ncbi:MAG: radical SAM protein [bacterium]